VGKKRELSGFRKKERGVARNQENNLFRLKGEEFLIFAARQGRNGPETGDNCQKGKRRQLLKKGKKKLAVVLTLAGTLLFSLVEGKKPSLRGRLLLSGEKGGDGPFPSLEEERAFSFTGRRTRGEDGVDNP